MEKKKLFGTNCLSDFVTIADLLQDVEDTDRGELERILLKRLPEKERQEYRDVVNGNRLPDLHTDIIAKAVFDPIAHPERVNYLIRKIMKDETLTVDGSFPNEGYRQSVSAKKVIFDIPFKLDSKTAVDVEVQKIAQEFIFNRADIYGSDILLMQYSAEPGQAKGEVNYDSVKDVLIIILMKDSPQRFKEYASPHYIHRFVERKADSGLAYTPLVKTVYVELDKCLQQFTDGTDGESNADLQLLLSQIADINNVSVKQAVEEKGTGIWHSITEHVFQLSRDKEVQAMLLAEKYAQADLNSLRKQDREEGRLSERENTINCIMNLRPDFTRKQAEEYAEKMSKQQSASM